MRRLAATLGILMAVCGAAGAHASTYEVGPGKPYAALEDVDDLLGPGSSRTAPRRSRSRSAASALRAPF